MLRWGVSRVLTHHLNFGGRLPEQGTDRLHQTCTVVSTSYVVQYGTREHIGACQRDRTAEGQL